MSGWMPNLFGKRDAGKSVAEAIVSLREQLSIIDKKEEHLDRRIEEEHKKAKTLVAANKTSGATAALRRKKALETQKDQLGGTRLTLETQLHALESANFNAQTLVALTNSQRAIKQIHKDLNVENVDTILEEMRQQIEDAKTVQEAIATPLDTNQVDMDELEQELADLEREALDERLHGETVPSVPTAPIRSLPQSQVADDDEAAQLQQLQASLAM